MIKIITLGSGSSGNGYIIECVNDNGKVEKLLIEAGVSFKSVQQSVNFDLSNIYGCLITHEHGDHAKYVNEYLRYNIPVYATKGTLKALALKAKNCHELTIKDTYKIGNFIVIPFDTKHDAVEPCGYYIDCPDGNRIMFATDTYYLKYKFDGVTAYMIECNYDSKILAQNIKLGYVHPNVGKRVQKSHMSLKKCIETLKSNDLSKTKAIILLHLSNNNSNKLSFIHAIETNTGKMVYSADSGLICHIY